MNTERRVLKNTIALSIGKVAGDLCTFFFLVYFGRLFGKAYLGKYAFAMSLCGILTVLINLGLNSLTIREISKAPDQEPRYIGNLLFAQGFLALGVAGILFAVTLVSGFDPATRTVVWLIGGYQIFYTLCEALGSGFVAHEEMHYPALLEVYHRLLILGMGLAAMIYLEEPLAALAAYPASALILFCTALLVYLARYERPQWKPDFPFIRSLFRGARPFFLMIVLGQLYDRVGVIYLTYLHGEAVTGVYSAADRLVTTVAVMLFYFGTGIFPVMAKASVNSRAQLTQICQRSVRVLIILVLPVTMLFIMFGRPLILLTFGPQFQEAIALLRLLAWPLVFIGLNQVISTLLIVMNLEGEMLRIRMQVLGIYLVGCFLMTWRWGGTGLALSRVSVPVMVFGITYGVIRQKGYAFHLVRHFKVPALACVLGLSLFYALAAMPLWLSVPAALAMYAAVIFSLKAVNLGDLLFLRSILLGSQGR